MQSEIACRSSNSGELLERFEWFNLDLSDSYARWRDDKLTAAHNAAGLEPVVINDLSQPTRAEAEELAKRCEISNFAVYDSVCCPDNPNSIPEMLRQFAASFGLQIAEQHRSADTLGVVALQPSTDAAKRDYIPYSTRSMNWHTDGYYNSVAEPISAFVLHCARPAPSGGTNEILDPEIAYIRLRDENPDYVRTLMHPQAMSIPADHRADGSARPVSSGPVFYPDRDTGRLQMRYTARSRSVNWRDYPMTLEASAFLYDGLQRGDPLARRISLNAGQGILNNNVLHNRTGFDDDGSGEASRLVYRVRFHNRITRSNQWQN